MSTTVVGSVAESDSDSMAGRCASASRDAIQRRANDRARREQPILGADLRARPRAALQLKLLNLGGGWPFPVLFFVARSELDLAPIERPPFLLAQHFASSYIPRGPARTLKPSEPREDLLIASVLRDRVVLLVRIEVAAVHRVLNLGYPGRWAPFAPEVVPDDAREPSVAFDVAHASLEIPEALGLSAAREVASESEPGGIFKSARAARTICF